MCWNIVLVGLTVDGEFGLFEAIWSSIKLHLYSRQ